jgi:hypothetical protein
MHSALFGVNFPKVYVISKLRFGVHNFTTTERPFVRVTAVALTAVICRWDKST